jgi:hypothetical protein
MRKAPSGTTMAAMNSAPREPSPRRLSLARRLHLAGVRAHNSGVPRTHAPFEGGRFNLWWVAGWDHAAFVAKLQRQAAPDAPASPVPENTAPRVPGQRRRGGA